ncbi:MAG UNVERIFIED_CONTAM: hypothetical protein LVR29_01260 [Microcystis novacekii LVE1205-3]
MKSARTFIQSLPSKIKDLAMLSTMNRPRAEFEEVQGFWLTQALKPEDVTKLPLSNCSESHPTIY